MRRLALVAALSILASPAVAADFKVGDRVQAWAIAWYGATVTEVGAGDHAGTYKVHFDDGRDDAYLPATSLRAPPNLAMAVVAASAPALPAGTYACSGVDAMAGLALSLQLGGGQYRQRMPDLAPGAYIYSPATRQISFTTGPYADQGWTGDVLNADGTTRIRLWLRDDDGLVPGVHHDGHYECGPGATP